MFRVACTFAAVVALWSPSVHALDVAGFEKLLEMSKRGIGDENGLQAKLSLMYYFQGVTDTVVGAHDKETGEVYYAGPRKICLPRSATLTSDVLQAMTEQQVRAAERSGAFKASWKSTNLNLFVFLALTTTYPCAER
jgi:hypothetical protein